MPEITTFLRRALGVIIYIYICPRFPTRKVVDWMYIYHRRLSWQYNRNLLYVTPIPICIIFMITVLYNAYYLHISNIIFISIYIYIGYSLVRNIAMNLSQSGKCCVLHIYVMIHVNVYFKSKFRSSYDKCMMICFADYL